MPPKISTAKPPTSPRPRKPKRKTNRHGLTITDALIEKSLASDAPNGHVLRFATSDTDGYVRAAQEDILAKHLLAANDDLFACKQNKFSGVDYVEFRELGRFFLTTTKSVCFDISSSASRDGLQISPLAALFRRVTSEMNIAALIREHFDDRQHQVFDVVQTLNACVARFRLEARTAEFLREASSRSRGTRKMLTSLEKYCDALLRNRSALCVLRFDLSYRKGAGWPDGEAASRPGEEILKHRIRFFALLEKMLPRHSVVGHIWKLEFGPRKTTDCHVLLFLDHERVQEDLMPLVEKAWVENTTDGHGICVNCANTVRKTPKSLAIGTVRRSDRARCKELRDALYFLVMTDALVRPKMPSGLRAQGRGIMPSSTRLAKKTTKASQTHSHLVGFHETLVKQQERSQTICSPLL